MFSLYQTPLDILYLVLTISVGLLAIFLTLAIIHLSGLLKNLKQITSKVKDTTDLINHYLWMPIKVALTLVDKGKEVAIRKSKKSKKSKK